MSNMNNNLKEYLQELDNAYYNEGESLITDDEYDSLKAQYLKSINKEEYDYVPGGVVSNNKVIHKYPILSLDKVQINDTETLRKRLTEIFPIVIQPKFDGLTGVYYGDKNIYATRGNAKIGDDITIKVKAGVKGLGKRQDYIIRGEILMLKSEFESINKERIAKGEEPFKNPRNATAGMLRNDDLSKIKGLYFYAYNILAEEGEIPFEEEMQILKENGWITPINYIPETVDDAIEYLTSFNRNSLDYEIDGLVAKHIGNKKFGFTAHHPKNSIAIKSEQTGVWSVLESVEWSTGKTGIVSPVANIKPVDILGSTVSRVTLHNIDYINSFSLAIGKEIRVIKANEIIPRIIESKGEGLKTIGVPDICPSCGSKTEFENNILYCKNPECEAQLSNKIINLASREGLNIEGLSEATVEKMIDYAKKNNVKLKLTLPFAFQLKDILKLEGFKDKSATKLYNNIQKAKNPELKNYIYATNIPLLGKSTSEDIANTLLTLDNLVEDCKDCFKKTSRIKGIGKELINNLNIYGSAILKEFDEANIVPKSVAKKKVAENQLTIVITGSFDIPRKEIEKIIKDAGHKTSGSVSAKTSILLASEGEESSSKYKKAVSLNTKIINSLDELKKMINM